MAEPDDSAKRDATPEEAFGARLRALREREGLSVRELAARLHRAHSGIVEYERGRRLPAVEVVEQYEDHFKLARGTLGALREQARVRRAELPRDGTLDEDLGEVVCPYKGLHAFEDADAALFFGREAQVERALDRLARVRFVAVVGASGAGKSSFVRAGLIAGLRERSGSDATRVVLLTPGDDPVARLAATFSGATGANLTADDLHAAVDGLHAAARSVGALGVTIVVDQLEELFAQGADARERRCFVDALMAAWQDPASPVSVVVALRADFYGRIAEHPELADAVVSQQELIGPMTATDLRRAIELPASRCGLTLQPGLAEAIVDDLAGEPGALPLLSHALLETWKRRRRLTLTLSGYQEAGGVRGAIAQTAELTLQRLPAADQQIARSIFLQLTDVDEGAEPTRRRVEHDELTAAPQIAGGADRVLSTLADARLVTVDERTVDIAHEALIRHWPRLRGWIEADRAGLIVHRRLSDAAREWQALDRDQGALYRGARLTAAQEWAGDHPGNLSALERDFLASSRLREHRSREAARRRARRLRGLSAGLAALSVVVTLVAIWALDQRGEARGRERQARSLALASAALPLLDSRPDVALLLALEAYRASPRVEARGSLLSALREARVPALVGILHRDTGPVRDVAFSADGRTLASLDGDAGVRLWDVRSRRQAGAALPVRGFVGDIALSPRGQVLATAVFGRGIQLWSTRTRRTIGAPLTIPGSRHADVLAFSSDGRRLAVGDGSTIRIWDVRARKLVGVPMTDRSLATILAFSPNGRTLASGSINNTIRLFDIRTGRQRGRTIRGHTSSVTSVAFSPDGHTLASASWDKTVRLWDVDTHEQRGRPLRGHTGWVIGVAFSPDGRRIASSSLDRTVRLWDVRTHRQLGTTLSGHKDAVTGVAFSHDGRLLASASTDTTIRLWDVRAASRSADRLNGGWRAVLSLAFSPDGRTLASAGTGRTVRLWDVRRQRRRRELKGHAGSVGSLAFSPDGRMLASGGHDDTVRLWDVDNGKQIGAPLAGPRQTTRVPGQGRTMRVFSYYDFVSFSRDGRMLVAGGNRTRGPQLWDLQTRVSSLLSGVTQSATFTPDGRTLAIVGLAGGIRFVDARTRKQLLKLPTVSTKAVVALAVSPDGRTLATGGEDRTVRLWDVPAHKQVDAPLAGHRDVVTSVAFSPDGRTLASGSSDATVRLWDVRAHRQLGTPLPGQPHPSSEIGTLSPASPVAFSPDGRTLASVVGRATIRLWHKLLWRNFAELEADVCALVGDGLTRREWEQYAGDTPYRRSCS